MKVVNGLNVIGIDHGNHNIKTANHCFVSGFAPASHDGIFKDTHNLLDLAGEVYTLSEKRVPVRNNKTSNRDFRVLTMFALGMEMQANHCEPGHYRAALSAALPPGHFSIPNLKQEWQAYLSGEYRFRFNNVPYSILTEKVYICPQGYSGLLTRQLSTRPIDVLAREPMALLIDIGGGTVDVIGLRYGKPIPEYHYSLNRGLVNAFNEINSSILAQSGNSLPESTIMNVLDGKTTRVRPEIQQLIHRHMRAYTEKLLMELVELQLPLDSSYVLVMGGGAGVLYQIWEKTGSFGTLHHLPDIRCTAQGLEEMACAALARGR